jgi:hypothetical protein
MSRGRQLTAGALLVFNGGGALFGGWNLIAHPDGSTLLLPHQLLIHTPFEDFLVPGIVLFVAIGLGSFAALWLLVRGHRYRRQALIIEGTLLCGWLVVQIILIRTFSLWQAALFAVGVALIAIGRSFADTPPISSRDPRHRT